MRDINGNVIDFCVIDAVGELSHGLYEVWLNDDRRLLTREPDAVSIWLRYVRSNHDQAEKTTRHYEPQRTIPGY